jgi:sugar phosphate permease
MDPETPEGHQNAHEHAANSENYSVFTPAEKWCIASLVSYAALFSTLSSFIYYPAIPSISRSLSVSVDQINWTVTSYMAVATIAPTLVGDAADLYGRRPIYVVALSLYLAANIAIAAVKTYPALVGLRVLQALAISGQQPPLIARGHPSVHKRHTEREQGPSPSRTVSSRTSRRLRREDPLSV